MLALPTGEGEATSVPESTARLDAEGGAGRAGASRCGARCSPAGAVAPCKLDKADAPEAGAIPGCCEGGCVTCALTSGCTEEGTVDCGW